MVQTTSRTARRPSSIAASTCSTVPTAMPERRERAGQGDREERTHTSRERARREPHLPFFHAVETAAQHGGRHAIKPVRTYWKDEWCSFLLWCHRVGWETERAVGGGRGGRNQNWLSQTTPNIHSGCKCGEVGARGNHAHCRGRLIDTIRPPTSPRQHPGREERRAWLEQAQRMPVSLGTASTTRPEWWLIEYGNSEMRS